MKKVLGRIKKYKLLVIGIIIGGVIFGGGVYASTIGATNVSYSNASSGVDANEVQTAIDKLYKKAKESDVSAPSSFSTDSWATIAIAAKSSSYPYQDYPYKVGDTKTVNLGSLGTHTVRIANLSTCSLQSQTACGFVIEFADIITEHSMNSSKTNVGGWPASSMRAYLNSTIYNALPKALQQSIIKTTVVSGHGSSDSSNFTSTDKLYLLSTQEVWGGNNSYDTANSTTRQLDYYKNKGVTTSNYSGAIKQYNGTNTRWWLRSANSNTTYTFFAVSARGDWGDTPASSTYGVAPAFRIA